MKRFSNISKNPYTVALLLIVVGATFLRMWRAPQLFSFALDEEYQALLAWEQVKNFHPIWIGVSAANLGYYLGPAFTYVNAALFWFSHGDPVILSYFSALLGVITTISLWFTTKDLIGKKQAVIAATIYGFSTMMIFYDRRFWNPTPIPFFSIWMVYSLLKAQKNSRWLILSSIIMAASFHSHISFWVFWPFLIFSIISVIKKISWSTWVLMVFGFVAVYSPLLVYDTVHNFDNFKLPFRILTNIKNHDSNQTYSFSTHFTELFNAFGRVWSIKPFSSISDESMPGSMPLRTPGYMIFAVFSIGIVIWNFVKQKDFTTKFLLSIIAAFSAAYLFYPGTVSEYYLLAFFPVLIMLLASFLVRLPKLILFTILGGFILFNAFSVFTTSQEYGLTHKKDLIQKISAFTGNNLVYLAPAGSYRTYGGWRYLFKVYGKTPTQSYSDTFFGWIYPDEMVTGKPVYKVSLSDVPIDTDPLLGKPVVHFSSGGYYGYVYKTK